MTGKKRTLSTSSSVSSSDEDEVTLTRCSAMLILKLEGGGNLTSQDVQKAVTQRLADIENQYNACQEMIRIHKKGSKEEAIGQRRAERLLKEKVKVSVMIVSRQQI